MSLVQEDKGLLGMIDDQVKEDTGSGILGYLAGERNLTDMQNSFSILRKHANTSPFVLGPEYARYHIKKGLKHVSFAIFDTLKMWYGKALSYTFILDGVVNDTPDSLPIGIALGAADYILNRSRTYDYIDSYRENHLE